MHIPGFQPTDDAFSVEPGGNRRIAPAPIAGVAAHDGTLTALRLAGRVPIILGQAR